MNPPEDLPENVRGALKPDLFVPKSWRKDCTTCSQEFRESPFTDSPVGFLRELVVMRRKGLSFDKSHLGKILSGDMVSAKDFEVEGVYDDGAREKDGEEENGFKEDKGEINGCFEGKEDEHELSRKMAGVRI